VCCCGVEIAVVVRFEIFTVVTMKNVVFFLQEPHGITSQKTPFFIAVVICI
jgi:hypothetical protein